MSGKKYYKTVKEPGSAPVVIIIAAAAVLIAALAVWLVSAGRKELESGEPAEPLTREDKYETYVGPAECEDRGEWVSVSSFYGLFTGDNREADLVSALFGEGEKKGIVPCGVLIRPVMVSYDDFSPFKSPTEKGFMSAYSTDAEQIELQMGIGAESLQLNGAYDTVADGTRYTGEAALELEDLSYCIVNLFDADSGDLADEAAGSPGQAYGYIEPRFSFGFSGVCRACRYDSEGRITGSMESVLDGRLEDGAWSWTADISGQQNRLFKNGYVYLRCKLPCRVTVSQNGAKETKNGTVNVYFRVDAIRVGTWQDCMPAMREEAQDGL